MNGNESGNVFAGGLVPGSTLPVSSAFADVGGSGISLPVGAEEPIRFGSSVVVDVIGKGGMSTVYKVWNEPLEVERVVKLLSADASSERFETEAKIIAKLRHENIVEVYSYGTWRGRPFMEMEYLDGSNLQSILYECGRLPENVSIAIALYIAEALAHAHNLTFTLSGKTYCGVIHRDIKPANIMIANNGAVKLSDFGIARPIEVSLHTLGNEKILGTLPYLSPEQMSGKNIDSRSDIYSFGLILYELLCGKKTFPHKSFAEIVKYKSANDFKPLAAHGVRTTSDIDKIMLRCLSLDPNGRYKDTQDLVDDLQKAYDSLTTQRPKDVIRNFFGYTGKVTAVYPAVESESESDPEPEERETPASLAKPVKPRVTETSCGPITAEWIAPAKKRKKWIVRIAFLMFVLAAGAFLYIDSMYQNKKESEAAIAADNDGKQSDSAEHLQAADAAASTGSAKMATKNTGKAQSPPADKPQVAGQQEKTQAAAQPADAALSKDVGDNAATAPVPLSAPIQLATPTGDALADIRKQETEQLRLAVNAIAMRQWDKAIAILEQEGSFKTRNGERTLHLFNAYVESNKFDKARVILDTTSLTQDAYFLLCAGKYWLYQKSPEKALGLFELSLTRNSIVGTKNVLPEASLYYIADIMQHQYRMAPSEVGKKNTLEAWRKVAAALASHPNDPRVQRAGMEINKLESSSK